MVNHYCVLRLGSPGQLHGQMAWWPHWDYLVGLRTRAEQSREREKLWPVAAAIPAVDPVPDMSAIMIWLPKL